MKKTTWVPGQIVKHYTRSFHQAQSSYFWRVMVVYICTEFWQILIYFLFWNRILKASRNRHIHWKCRFPN